MDAVILAGGLGTRLKGIWDKPKCLVPVETSGETVLHHLLRDVAALRPRAVSFALGHLAQEVMAHFFEKCAHLLPRSTVCYFAIEKPGGTAIALRTALASLAAPVLVLNGDTLPYYDLQRFTDFHEQTGGHGLTVAVGRGEVQAGGYIFGDVALRAFKMAEAHTCLADYVEEKIACGTSYIYPFAQFLDVGTPEGFALATSKGAP